MSRSTFGIDTLFSRLIGRRFWLRLFRATPPAMPASAAPPARSGAFAFDASPATFPPVLATGLFGNVFRGDLDVLPLSELLGLDELVRRELERLVADEPFLLVVLLVLEPVLDLLLLEDFVVCAIVVRLSWLPCQLRCSRRRWALDYPMG